MESVETMEKMEKLDANMKILIADENPAQRQALCNELRRAGFSNLEEAGNGEEALIKIGRYHPDVAILDVWLSKLDGIGVLRNCKSMHFGDDLPPAFIIVSMVSNQSIFMEAAHAGADLGDPLSTYPLAGEGKNGALGRGQRADRVRKPYP